ncbi:uncharacterized protein LOC126734133 [Anthonomus grandis grandis]|uniref:uncharacterized protein LOC126734133 n=1 Tax=Anthonomus grandis grandis TaxID=2921223 RepID=UPI0021651789|nr:uncharacterized protein LOC126734133 [Anthonomus grandis grandis]XP_050293623.1 uncharacterized protein LOC126734133 [Anthonomus grandis grandis]
MYIVERRELLRRGLHVMNSVSKMLSDSEDYLLENSALKVLCLKGVRSYTVHPLNQERHTLGEYHNLFPQLKEYPGRFFQYTRMEHSTFVYILDLIQPEIVTKFTNFVKQPIEPEEKLVITLRYLATGSSFKSLSFSFRVGASTVSRIVKETVNVLWNVLQPLHMQHPSKEIFAQTSKEFSHLWNFPNCMGCIDGNHVRISCPPHSGTMFSNYKKFYSIVLLGVCDAKYRFHVIDVGGFGKQSDGATFASCDFYHMIKNNQVDIPDDACLPGTNFTTPLVFLADEAFPLSVSVLTPHNVENLNDEKMVFNKRHARKSIECTFGIMFSK